MKKILYSPNLFSLQQNIYVINNDNIIECHHTTMENYAKTILALAQQFDVKEILIDANKNYGAAVAEDLSSIATTQYGLNDLDIIIER